MKLRTKLVLAQLPLALALAALGLLSGFLTNRLGEDADRILADNHRSVLSAQRMKALLDRIDRLTQAALVARAPALPAEAADLRDASSGPCGAQEVNITEPGERRGHRPPARPLGRLPGRPRRAPDPARAGRTHRPPTCASWRRPTIG